MTGERPADEGEILRQLGEQWDVARSELVELRRAVGRAEQMGQAQMTLSRARSELEAVLLRLGEGLYRLVESGEVVPPPALKRAIGEVRTKEVDVLRQQADIAAILKEADALAEKNLEAPAKKKSR